ncbi:MAG: hypothetical protein E7487_03180 [Ruminococcaceae bacterium]|nr:hypothetical protein [Oscillospiraceae bacterium]
MKKHDIRSVTERFCPSANRNVALEISINENGERIERCLFCHECDGHIHPEKGCVLHTLPSKSTF